MVNSKFVSGRKGAAALVAVLIGVAACSVIKPAPTPTPTPTPTLSVASPNLDSNTQALIAQAQRVVFVVPFSHWDTDWHDTYANYVQRTDGNILAAIQMAKADRQYRYAFEQVLFVKHFWDTHPEARADLKALVQNRQLTFAWGGITQPVTTSTRPRASCMKPAPMWAGWRRKSVLWSKGASVWCNAWPH